MPGAATQLSVVAGADPCPRRPPGSRVRAASHHRLRGLSKRFNDAVIYDDFDIDFPRGEIVTIFGPNGCGKSTLINLIAGLIPFDAGQVMIGGKTMVSRLVLRVPELSRSAVSRGCAPSTTSIIR